MSERRRRILFFAEAVTLAHVARTSVLAGTLDPSRFEVHAAWDPRYNHLLGELPFRLHDLSSLPTEVFLRRLGRGVPMHDTATFRSYTRDDLALIERVAPELIVSDFRLSLAVSARMAGVPVVAIANAYWSPYARQTFLFPEYEYPLSRVLGDRAARALFRLFRNAGFAAHCRPLNRVLREHGLAQIGSDIRTMYTWGDYTAYCDIPDLVPTWDLPWNHMYIGPVLWSPRVARPDWWDRLPPDRPVVYATLGSSGDAGSLSVILEALAPLPVTVIAATAGRARAGRLSGNAYLADFLPGVEASSRADLVICNGGSPTTYQALAAGVPVLGLVSNNMDQHLNMEAVQRYGAGVVMGAGRANAANVRAEVTRMLAEATFRERARRLSRTTAAYKPERRLPVWLESILKNTTAGSRRTPGSASQEGTSNG